MSTTSYDRVRNDTIRLLLIQFALGGKEKDWLDILPLNTITMWEEFLRLFLKWNLPMTIVLIAYERLFDFKQESIEMLGQAWERFKRIV